MNKSIPPPPIIILIIPLICIMIMNIFGYEIIPEELTLILIIATVIGVIIYFKIFKVTKREAEKPVIKEIIEKFIDEAIKELERDKLNSEGFEFPDSLNYFFGIPTNVNAFKRFSKKARIMNWRINRYNKFCGIIKDKITKLGDKAIAQGLIKPLNHVERIVDTKGNEGIILGWTERYEDLDDKEKDELLKEHKLYSEKAEIKELKKGLPDKIEKLSKKLDELKWKWKDKYFIIE